MATRFRQIAGLWLMGLLILLPPASRAASPLKDPKRIVQGQTVDLSALFKWWPKREGERPLSGWAHVTGPVVGTNGWGWILEGHAEGGEPVKGEREKPGRLILKNPPLQEFGKFSELLARSKALNDQRNALTVQANKAEGQAAELAGQQKVNRQHHVASSSALKRETRYWQAMAKQEKDRIKTVDKELKEVENQLKAYPDKERYAVDCLALRTGEKQNGMAVYDHGVVLR